MTSRKLSRPRGRRWHWLLLAVVVIGTVVAVIANRSGARPVVPKAFGQNGKCYYVRSPQEVTELQLAGRCPAASQPARMPQSWLILYYPFYNSDYYSGTFVAPSGQAGYRSYMQTFDAQNADEIEQEAPTAEYMDGDGDEVTGAKAGVSSDDTSIGDDDSSSGYAQGSGTDNGGGGGDDDGDDDGGDDGGDDGD